MQYATPQFIEEEGRIVFFLTFRQFFLLVGGLFACILFYYILPFWLFLVLAIPIILSVGAIAFLKINNESIVKVLLHFIGFSMAKKNYVWKKKELPYPIGSEIQTSKINDIKKMVETKSK